MDHREEKQSMKLKIRPAEERDIPEIKHLTDIGISEDYYSEEDFRKMLTGEGDVLHVAVDEDRDELVVSFFYTFALPLRTALRLLHIPDLPDEVLGLQDDDIVAAFKTASTRKEYRGMGLVSDFYKTMEARVREMGAKVILGTALVLKDGKIPIHNIMHAHGFEGIYPLDKPWKDVPGYCPYCGSNPCMCEGMLYCKRL